ncbi:flagellar protein FlgN [Altererythrobacter lauratis]|uniref:Flagellar protein FlgN n=1 Tax=Alteraurantiacibacter lauratis TaxID=2054627 RepID=A0ABV7EBD0_9SPHN
MTAETSSPALSLAESLRQMLAVLETERQALAAMDVDALVLCTGSKSALLSELEDCRPPVIDAECRSLLEAARHQNEVNRKIRNLLAANVAARLDALTRQPGLYRAPQARIA